MIWPSNTLTYSEPVGVRSFEGACAPFAGIVDAQKCLLFACACTVVVVEVCQIAVTFSSTVLSKEAQRGAAIEILNRVDGEAADREAARLRTASG